MALDGDADPHAATTLGAPAGSSSANLDTALAPTAAGDATPGPAGAPVELARGSLVDRYVVLAKLGAGGMGVVYAGYDPELDRKVALKLLHPRLAADADPFAARDARARMVREAQALARLNHPHIVAIHDVGEQARAVWLAMEYVDGETLSAWMKRRRRTWREALDVVLPAARGLSAAHAAGLVHRDIKPDNIMIGADGRVRVMDLGLARARVDDDAPAAPVAPAAETAVTREITALNAQVTRTGSVLGTPAYMSPEQFRGEPVDARTDVFSLCATLWEVLMGERPFAGDTLVELAANVLSGAVRPVPRDPEAQRVPGWLRRVCLRGLAAQPGRRIASMAALLDELTHGRTRARTRAWLAGVAAVATVGVAAALVRSHDLTARAAACEAAGAGILEVWNDEARAAVRAGLVDTGVSYAPATADRVMPVLDRQAGAWREQRAGLCRMADLEGTLDAALLDRAVWCLDERRMELAALVDELSRADTTAVNSAVVAAADLPPVSPCGDRQVLAALPAPPASRDEADAVRTMLSRARTASQTGKPAVALNQASTALAAAEALGWPPLTAAARQLEGSLLAKTGVYAKAEEASLRAYMDAAKVRAWDVAANAATDLVYIVGPRQARPAEGSVWAGHAEVAILFAGDPMGLGEAHRLNNLAGARDAAGAYAEAKDLFARALAIREQALGPDHPDVATSLNNLARVNTTENAEAKRLLERALAIREKALSPDHPDVATSLASLAEIHSKMGDYAEAKRLQARALAIREEALGPEHPEVAVSLNSLASATNAAGATAEAKLLLERALAIREKALGREHPEVAASLNSLAIVAYHEGAYAEARALFERVVAIQEKVQGPDHLNTAVALGNLANIHMITGAYAEAAPLQKRALAIKEKALGLEDPSVAESLANLASLYYRMGAPAEAKPLFERALAIQEAKLGPEHPALTLALDGLASVHIDMGAHAAAKPLLVRALAISEKARGPDHPSVAAILGGLGNLALEQGRAAEAIPPLERAVRIYDAHPGAQRSEPVVRLGLARALVRTGGDRARALAEAHKAADGFRAIGQGQAADLAEAEAFIARYGKAR